METLRPFAQSELADVIRGAAAQGIALAVQGAGTKRGLGRPVGALAALDLSAFTGIVAYEPEELVLSARPGTPLAAIEATLRSKGQQLAFEPPDYGALLGTGAGRATLGGTISAGLAGPRRFRAGGARDHLLGVAGVNGRGEVFKAGGRVMKNVTGYDVPKLMAGSFGTLAALTEVTLRVAPAPETQRTLAVRGLSDTAGLALLRTVWASPLEPSGLAHLPAGVAVWSGIDAVALPRTAITLIRVEGPAEGIPARLKALRQRTAPAEAVEIGPELGAALWREIRDVTYFADGADFVWKLTLPPASAASVLTEIAPRLWFYDWAGGLIWLTTAPAPGADAGVVRRALARTGGQATLVRAPEDVRARVPVFTPQEPALARLGAGVKEAFDPAGILNPGRMYAGQ